MTAITCCSTARLQTHQSRKGVIPDSPEPASHAACSQETVEWLMLASNPVAAAQQPSVSMHAQGERLTPRAQSAEFKRWELKRREGMEVGRRRKGEHTGVIKTPQSFQQPSVPQLRFLHAVAKSAVAMLRTSVVEGDSGPCRRRRVLALVAQG